MPKICPKCMADLPHANLGQQALYSIAVVGATSSGKSNLVIIAVWQLMEAFAPRNDIEVRFGSPAEEAVYQQYKAWLEQGLVLQKTVSLPVPKAFTLSLLSPHGRACSLYLYDAAGEDFQEEQQLASHPLEKYDGIIMVVDPFAEEGARRGLLGPLSPEELARVNAAPLEASEILGRLVNVLERVLRVPLGSTFQIPLAVVVTKIDACDLVRRLRLGPDRMAREHFTLGTAAYSAERHSGRVREFLCSFGLSNFVGVVESRFACVAYFPVSALGRSFDPSDRSTFRPYGLLAPLIWLCYHTDALSDGDSFERTFMNFNIAFIRSLRGFDGARARVASWGMLGVLVVLILIPIYTLPLTLVIVAGGIQVTALLALYGCLLYQLVKHRFQ